MKRLALLAVLVSSIGVAVVSRAACTGPGVAAGDHGEAVVQYHAGGHKVHIHTSAFGNFVLGPAQACADGSVGVEPTTGFVTVTVDDVVICHNTNGHPNFDPFVFGGGIHNDPADACGADVTWDGLSWMIGPKAPKNLPNPPAVGVDGTGAWAGDEQPAIVDGIYWVGCDLPETCTIFHVPNGTVGWFSNHGAQVAAYT